MANPVGQAQAQENVELHHVASPVGRSASRCQKIALLILFTGSSVAIMALAGGIVALPIAAYLASYQILAIGAGVAGGIGLIGSMIVSVMIARRLYNDKLTPIWREQRAAVDTQAKVHLTRTPEETTQLKIDLVRKAKSSVELSGNFCGGKPFRDLLEALLEARAANPKLKARFISSAELLESADHAKLAQVKNVFGEDFECLITCTMMRIYDRPNKWLPGLHSIENHVKILVVDGKYSVIGGTNLQTNLCRSEAPKSEKGLAQKLKNKLWTGAASDMDAFVDSEKIAESYRFNFYQLWNKWAAQVGKKAQECFDVEEACEFEVPGSVAAEGVQALSSGFGREANPISEEIARQISVSKTIDVANLTFNLQGRIKNALLQAASDGSQIRVITNGHHKKMAASVKGFASSHFAHYHDLFESAKQNNVTIYHCEAENVMYHKKLWVFDRALVVANSNLGWKSEYADDEFGLFIRSEDLAQVAREIFKDDLNPVSNAKHRVTTVTKEEARKKHKSFKTRFQANIVSAIAA